MAQESWDRDASDGSGCQQQEGLVLCSNNCGLLGCAATMNLCPKCFREFSLKKQNMSSDQASMSMVEKSVISVFSDKSLAAIADKSVFSDKSLPSMSEKSVVSMVQVDSLSNLSRSAVAEPSSPSSSHAHSSCSCGSVGIPTPSPSISQTSVLSISELFYEKEGKQPLVMRRQGVNRCLTCRKRTGLLGFKCRCGNVFCSTHRYSDKHNCPYDYKSAAREAIAKANPVVIAQKVQKI